LKPSEAARALATEHLLADIRGRSVRGGAITFGAQAGKVVLQLATVVVLVRLLSPGAFGIIAMVAALSSMLDFVKELGLSAATIRKTEINHAQVSVLFWINAAAGAALAALLFAAAPLVADFYHDPAVAPIARWLSPSFLLSGLTVQHWALLRRQMRFRATIVVDIGSDLVGFVVAVTMALEGANYWSLVAQRLAVPLYGVGMPTLSRIVHQEERYRRAFNELFENLAMVLLPGAALLAVTADWIVHILFGPRWAAATPLVAWFAAAAVFLPLVQMAGLLYLSQNRPREMVRAGLIDLALCVFAVGGSVHFGAVGVAAALALVGIGLRLPIGFWLATRRGPVRFGDLWAALMPATLAAVATVMTVLAVRHFVMPAGTPALVGMIFALLIAAAAAAGTYVAMPRSRRALRGLGRLAHDLRRQQPALKT
jgi:O-antigen/teichoic acid export membrane protein